VTRFGMLTKTLPLPKREFLVLAGLLLLAGLGLIAVFSYHRGLETAAPQAAKPQAETAPAPIAPGFDVIRVTRDGRAVMAGRASPGAEIHIKSGDQLLGQTQADKYGDWVLIPETALKPGAQMLTLSAQLGQDGPVLSKDSAIISVPAQEHEEVFVAVSQPGKATRILDQGETDPAASPEVSVAGIDLAPEGGAILSGRAEPGRLVRVYVNNQIAGEAVANDKGDWELAFKGPIGPGAHSLRGDQLDSQGKVLLRAEVTFSRSGAGRLEMGAQQVVVMQGNALWEIARKIYGSGIAYSMIFTSNQQQIRNPDLIYPGQVLDIPPAGQPAYETQKPPVIPGAAP